MRKLGRPHYYIIWALVAKLQKVHKNAEEYLGECCTISFETVVETVKINLTTGFWSYCGVSVCVLKDIIVWEVYKMLL